MQRIFRGAVLVFAVVLMATACSNDTPAPAASGDTTTPTATGSDSGRDDDYGGGGKGYGDPSSSGGATIPIGDDEANDHGTKDVSGMTSVRVEQNNDSGFYFAPTVLSGSAGQQLTIKLENSGTFLHTFTIDDQNIDVNLQPGDEQDIQVAFPNSGFVAFYCSLHRSMGMVGELLVG